MQDMNRSATERGGLSRLDLNLLRVFDLVYRERHLGRAAAALHRSQPAVSHALARLRRQLDDPLFRREGGRLVATPRAEQLAPRLAESLAALETLLRPVREFDPARELRRVRLAMADEMEPMLLPPLLARLAEQAPEVLLSSVRIERSELKTDLAAGRLDLAVDIAQPVQGLRHAPLFTDRYCVLAAQPQRLTLAGYRRAAHVAVSSRRSGPAMEEFELGRLGIERQVRMRCQSHEAAARAVAESALLLTLPRAQGEWLSQRFGLRLLALPMQLPAVQGHLYWHPTFEEAPANRWLRSQMMELARAGRASGTESAVQE
jgi:DNA-binding transcriptional LysR family regulator